LDPQLGVLIFLAECYESNGQLASAWATFHQAEDMAQARGDRRVTHARERVAVLEPRVSRLNVMVPPNARVGGLSVYRNGMALKPVAWGVATPTDGGQYLLQATAPGHKNWTLSVTVPAEGGNVSVMVPELESLPNDLLPLTPAPAESAPIAKPAASSPPPARIAPIAPASVVTKLDAPAVSVDDAGRSRRIAALTVGGLGIVGLGVGGVLGVSAHSSFDDSGAFCNDGGYCTAQGTSLRERAHDKAFASTVVTSVGAAAVITGIVLWVTAPDGAARQPDRARAAWSLVPAAGGWGVGAHHAF
jgi:hypothetical protein